MTARPSIRAEHQIKRWPRSDQPSPNQRDRFKSSSTVGHPSLFIFQSVNPVTVMSQRDIVPNWLRTVERK